MTIRVLLKSAENKISLIFIFTDILNRQLHYLELNLHNYAKLIKP